MTAAVGAWTDQTRGAAKEIYRSRLVSLEDAVSRINSGDRIWISAGQRVTKLISGLLPRVLELEGVQLKGLPMGDFGWYSDVFQGHLRVDTLFGSAFSREALASGRADFTPWWVWGGQKALEEGRPGTAPFDVTFIGTSPPNEWGYCCFGSSLWEAKTMTKHSNLVICEVNENHIRTFGDTWIHVSEIDAFVESDEPVPEAPATEPAASDMPIAEYVATLINDGDTLQFGTGTTSGFIPTSGVLDNKQDLGYFAELTVRGTIELAQKGVITSRYMDTHPGKFITTTAGNSPEDHQYINENPMFEFYDTDYIHSPAAIARNDNMVAIDNAITVDLNGQIGASTIGPRIWSGTGGHLSYALGAFMSKGGRYICVLPSTAVSGTKSRIVSQFEPGQVVTVPQDISDIVVTEYGVAHLLNKTLRERADELISIAHPDFRADLRREAGRAL